MVGVHFDERPDPGLVRGDTSGTKLAASIAEHGLLHPVVITPERLLIAGERRLMAAQRLGWMKVPVTIVPIADLVRGEVDENRIRLDFAPTEMAAVAEVLRPAEEKAAKERQRAGGGIPGSGKIPEPGRDTRDRVAAHLGVSGSTLEKIEAIVAAEAADPELAPIVAEMDRTGNVSKAYRELRRIQSRAAVAAAPLPSDHVTGQRYKTIVIDPPWDKGDEGDVDQIGRAQPTYATMPIADIAALPVGDDAEADAHIYVWITNRSLPKGFDLLRGWGFRYITTLLSGPRHSGLTARCTPRKRRNSGPIELTRHSASATSVLVLLEPPRGARPTSEGGERGDRGRSPRHSTWHGTCRVMSGSLSAKIR